MIRNSNDKKQKAALYVRVSTHHQIDRDSLPFQRKELINYAKYVLGIDDFEIFEDAGYSAKNTDRPQYQEMMRRIRNGEFSHLLVWKIDRISRNLRDFTEMYDELKKYGITFISKNEQFDTGNPMGEAMVQIILVFAELERKLTAERVMGIMLSRAEKGLWNGAPMAFGAKWSEDDEYPVRCPDEYPSLCYIYDKYEELRSSNKVANLLNAQGIRSKRNGTWTSKVVADIIRNPFYKGTFRYNVRESGRGKLKDESEVIVIENNHEPYIDPEQWERCNAIMDKNSTRNTADNRKNTGVHVFSGLVECVACGSSCHAGFDRPRNDGYRPSRYRCTNQTKGLGCDNKMISEVSLGPFVINYVANFVKAQQSLRSGDSLKVFESMLLRGKVFKEVAGIERDGLEQTYLALLYGGKREPVFFEQPVPEEDKPSADSSMVVLQNEKEKHERAAERLQNLYLYSEQSMPEKDFLIKRKEIADAIEALNVKIREQHKIDSSKTSFSDISFLQKASYFYMTNELLRSRMIDYRKLITTVDKQLVKDFMATIIKKIDTEDGKVKSITFRNGLCHKIVYKN